MNYREPPHAPARTRKAFHCLALLLLTAMAPHGAHGQTRSHLLGVIVGRSADPIPYLVAVGAPPLRFQPAPFVPEAVNRPSSSATRNNASAQVESTAAPASVADLASTTDANSPSTHTPAPATETSPSLETSPQPAKTPAAILPDDVRPTVRPEDFLPYFQVPGSGRRPGNLNVVVPVPNTAPAPTTLPPSSATYTQTPK